MKLLLIFPMGKANVIGKYSRFRLAPLTLPYLAALTPKDVDITIIDELVDEIDFNVNVDLVGITALTPLAPRAYEIADKFRSRGIKVVLGGVHATMCPDEAALHTDAIVLGEAEETWPRLIEDLKRGRLQKRYTCSRLPSLKGIPIPRWDLVKMGYLPIYTIQTSRGCPFDCEFCAVTAFFGGRYRFRPLDEVLSEVEVLIRSRKQRGPLGNIFFFTDDNIYANPRRSKELCRTVTSFRMKWFAQAPISIAWDKEFLKLASKSGCIGVLIGFESLFQPNLDQIGKKINKVAEYGEAIRRIHSYGIKIMGSFMFGLDYDEISFFGDVVKFMNSAPIDVPSFTVVTPYPGTRFYRRLQKEGRLLSNDWTEYDSNRAVHRPLGMTPQEVNEHLIWAWKRITSFSSILRRTVFSSSRSLFYFIYNLVLRRMTRKKLIYPVRSPRQRRGIRPLRGRITSNGVNADKR